MWCQRARLRRDSESWRVDLRSGMPMNLRHSKLEKNGKTHTYWRLVKSERVGGKVRQVTVAELGELDIEGYANAKDLAKHSLGPRSGQRELFEDTEKHEPLKVLIDRVRVG